MSRTVVVTGMGVVSPLGNGVETFGRRMLAGESGIRGLRGSLVPAGFPVPYGGVVQRDGLPMPRVLAGEGRVPDCHRFGVVAVEEGLVLVQGVRHVFDRLRPVVKGEAALVFITNGVEQREVEALWHAMKGLS